MSELLRLITLQDPSTRIVLLGTVMLGVACGVVGTLSVLRKRSLMGDAAAHAALPGVCAAYLVIGDRSFAWFLAGALVFALIGSAMVWMIKSYTRVKEDAAIAIAIGGFFGLGVVMSRMIQNQPGGGNKAGLDGFIFGKAASMVRSDALMIAITAGLVVTIVVLLYKEYKLLCFDHDFAAGQGWPTRTLDLLLMVMVCVCVVVGLPAVGVVLVVALLVIPPVAARFWSDRLGVVIALSALFGGMSGLIGTVLSGMIPVPKGALSHGWPTGPLIVLSAAVMFVTGMLIAPRRGVIAAAVRRARLRRRIAVQNLLRDAYELLESSRDWSRAWSTNQLARASSISPLGVRLCLGDGLIQRRGAAEYVLTASGLEAAARVVRTHRVWELFLIEQADIAPDHVDRDADEIEHILPHELITQICARLALQGRLPDPEHSAVDAPAVPISPHPISTNPVQHTPPAKTGGPLSGTGVGMFVLAGVIGVLMPTSGTEAATSASDLFMIAGHAVRSDDLWTLAAATCCSIACSLVGCFLVLRKMSLLGDAISHAILPGLAGAFIFTGTRDPLAMLAGATVVGVLTALLSTSLSRWGRVPEDAAMGVVFTSLFALGVIMITLVARDVDLDPGCVLYGVIELVPFDTVSVLGMTIPKAVLWLGGAMLMNIALIAVFYKELKIVSFDAALATTMGISASAVHAGLMTCVAATTVVSFEAVGSILVVAMLVTPGAAAQLLTDRLSRMLPIAGVLAGISAVVGYALAVWLNTSVAGMIATVSMGVFLIVAVIAPRHGMIARSLSTRQIIVPQPAADSSSAAR